MGLSNQAIGLIGVVGLMFMVVIGVRIYIAATAVGLVGLIAMLGWSAGAGIVGTIPHSKSVQYTLSVLPMFILIGYLALCRTDTGAVRCSPKMAWLDARRPRGINDHGYGRLRGSVRRIHCDGGRFLAGRHPGDAQGGLCQASRRWRRGGRWHASCADPAERADGHLCDHRRNVGGTAAHRRLHPRHPVGDRLQLHRRRMEHDNQIGKPIEDNMGERFKSVPGTLPVLSVVVIIFRRCICWATPTEAGALGAFVVFVLALARGMKYQALHMALLETAKLTVMIFSLVWGILVFVRFLGFAGLPEMFTQWIVSLPLPPTMIIIMILCGYFILGMFMDAIGMMLLTLPVVFPAVMALGYDPIWFGIVVVKMAEVCLVTPPIGLNCFVVASVRPDIPLATVFRGVGPFLIADAITLAIFIAFPAVITWLPDQMLN